MSLTGLPLILLTWALAVAAIAATVRWWRVTGRRRVPVRIAGLILIEVLVVAGVGLIVNRRDSFYPSWRALGGVRNVVTVPSATAGRLDGELDAAAAVTWAPPETAAWHLAAAPRLIAPADYAGLPGHSFPVIVALTAAAHIPPVTGAVVVVLRPTAATSATALAGLPAGLGRDARVTDHLAIVADPAWAHLAAAWPGHPPVVAGHDAAAFDKAVRDLPAPLAAPERLPS